MESVAAGFGKCGTEPSVDRTSSKTQLNEKQERVRKRVRGTGPRLRRLRQEPVDEL
jgi:hypothetical protein